MTTNKTEQSNKKQIQNFLICAWNGLKELTGEHDNTYYYYPQADWEQDKLAEAVKRMLRSRGLEAVDCETDADLIVLVPRHSDLPYQISDARIFHRMLYGSRKHVLLIDRLGTLSVSPEIWPEWFYCFKDASFDSSKFTKWIESARLTQSERFFRSLNYSNLGCELLAGNKLEFHELLAKAKSKKLSRSGTCLLLSDKLSQFFYGLLRMSCRYDRLEHDMNKKISDVFTSDTKSLLRTNRQKKFLDFCVDLKRALRVPVNDKTKNANGAANNGKLILVIDDRPDLIKDQIKKIQEMFFSDFSIYIWKPSQKKNELSLSDIAEYNSLKKSDQVLCKFMPWFSETESKTFPMVGEVLSSTRFVIVDILFPDDDGNDKPKGIDVIRGLQRLSVDLPTREHTQKQEKKLFDIVALSRADDMDKIQAALQSGACGYVFKSRLLALPGVLGELETSIREPITKLHRNFRSLYNLPNETIKLLQTATISPKLSFHVSTQENKQGKKTKNRKSQIQALPMANLLATIPKADLHVHVGSCMSPEFLVVASLIMLLRHKPDSDEFKKLQKAVPNLVKIWMGKTDLNLQKDLNINPSTKVFTESCNMKDKNSTSIICNLAKKMRNHLKSQIKYYQEESEKAECSVLTISKPYKLLRSILHKDLGLPDHLDEERLLKKLSDKPDVTMFLFALTHRDTCPVDKHIDSFLSQDDLLRIFLLFLAANNYDNSSLNWENCEVLKWFRPGTTIDNNISDWKYLHDIFYGKGSDISPDKLRSNNWRLEQQVVSNFKIRLPRGDSHSGNLWPLDSCPDYDKDTIAYLLATGTRCSNLKTYLDGCEFSGAEHLRHPFLLHLYAQQTVHQFVNQGVMYAELRAAVSGYENRDFNFKFQDACNCLQDAFHNAQRAILKEYHESRIKKDEIGEKTSEEDKPVWLWEEPFGVKALFKNSNSKQSRRRFPAKVSLILTGKRHKPTRQMLREAASATVLHTLPSSNIKTAQEFVSEDMDKCRLVGFDLAGQEDDEHAPHLFRSEFEHISKMHIPITVHAGENAPAGFVESAVLDLRARRIGHGLALIEDKQLMNRLREDGVCVELCPVSNFQTNQFVPAVPTDGKSLGREYPLRAFLKNGNAVCLNTDNPIISYTNMVKECFQASYAFGGNGLSLWEMLRILRMGFVHSFLSLPERRSILELADQILFDLFSDPGVVEDLRCMAASVTVEGVIDHERSKAGPNN
jgi:adenosine deaminase